MATANLRGELVLTFHKAEGLKDVQTFGKQDPYVKITFDKNHKTEKRTKTHEGGGTTPVWNQKLSWLLDGREDQVKFEIMDTEATADRIIGTVDISLLDLVKSNGRGPTFYNVMGKHNKHGTIQVSTDFIPTPAAPVAGAGFPAQPAFAGPPGGYPMGPPGGYPMGPPAAGYPGFPPGAPPGQFPYGAPPAQYPPGNIQRIPTSQPPPMQSAPSMPPQQHYAPAPAAYAPAPSASEYKGEVRAQNATAVNHDEYEHVLIVDRSGSMGAFSDCAGGMTRWAYALECCEAFVAKICQIRKGPMKLVFFSNKIKLIPQVTADKLGQLWEQYEPMGSTDMAGALQTVFLDHFERRSSRVGKQKLLAVMITDGAPDDKKAVADAIIEATLRMTEDSEIGLQMIQIGKDDGAKEFLNWLDISLQQREDPSSPDYAEQQALKRKVGIKLSKFAKFDIVDTTTAEAVEDRGGLKAVLDMAITD